MIEYVQIDGRKVNISTDDKIFSGYFGIDSMGLMLGPNGAGKTRLMINVAEALTSGTQIGDQGHWRGRSAEGREIGQDIKYPPEDLGVMYYTPLPYRRHISRHAQFIDASAFNNVASRSKSLRQFQFIAQRLGVKTELVGRLSYRGDIFRRIIVPRMLEADCTLNDSAMNSYLLELKRISDNPFDDVDYKRRLDHFSRRIEYWILSAIISSDHQVLLLACLEHAAKSPSQRASASKAFLLIVGVAIFKETEEKEKSPKNQFDVARFRNLIATTEEFLEEAKHSGLRTVQLKEQEGVEFQFDLLNAPRTISSKIGAFEIEWTNLSSGLLSLVEQFTRLELGLERLRRRGILDVLILIDEGDAYLHMDWQRQYITHLDHFLSGMKGRLGFNCLQVLLATHSPIISGDFPATMIQRLGVSKDDSVKTFGNSLDALVLEAFGTPSIGEFAANKIKDLRRKFVSKTMDSRDLALLAEIGDEGLRAAITSQVGGAQ
jgi:hypothetical protein